MGLFSDKLASFADGQTRGNIHGKREEVKKTIQCFITLNPMAALREVAVICIISVVLAILLGALITRSIIRPINRIIEGLNEGAGQVASAFGQVSSSSQQLAEGVIGTGCIHRGDFLIFGRDVCNDQTKCG